MKIVNKTLVASILLALCAIAFGALVVYILGLELTIKIVIIGGVLCAWYLTGE